MFLSENKEDSVYPYKPHFFLRVHYKDLIRVTWHSCKFRFRFSMLLMHAYRQFTFLVKIFRIILKVMEQTLSVAKQVYPTSKKSLFLSC